MHKPQLFLHAPEQESGLKSRYQEAFLNATSLYVVSAYLTDWDSSLVLNEDCMDFQLIVGRDFGITRKNACKKVIEWLPKSRKHQFMVADSVTGFHPKALFWKDKQGKHFSIIGSSNLTRAAFHTNYEANVYSEIDEQTFNQAKEWMTTIKKQSVVVSESWLNKYVEGQAPKQRGSSCTSNDSSVETLILPSPKGSEGRVKERRVQINIHKTKAYLLHNLFKDCAEGRVSSTHFYNELRKLWSVDVGNRLQGKGWEIKGKHSDFKELSVSYMKIASSSDLERDNVVARELNRLEELEHPARKAFFSEILCLKYPKHYLVLNNPIRHYIKTRNLTPTKESSEGSMYIDLAMKLRLSLEKSQPHPAENLAELDAVLELQYKNEINLT